jgi:hypothetical protein
MWNVPELDGGGVRSFLKKFIAGLLEEDNAQYSMMPGIQIVIFV